MKYKIIKDITKQKDNKIKLIPVGTIVEYLEDRKLYFSTALNEYFSKELIENNPEYFELVVPQEYWTELQEMSFGDFDKTIMSAISTEIFKRYLDAKEKQLEMAVKLKNAGII
jgi:hypothetical protein